MNPLHFYPAYINPSGLSVALWSTVLWRIMAPGPACIQEASMTHRQNPPWVWESCSVRCAVPASLVWPFQIPPLPQSIFHHSAPLCFLCCDTHTSITWHNSAFDSSSSSQYIIYRVSAVLIANDPYLQWMGNFKPLFASASTTLALHHNFRTQS